MPVGLVTRTLALPGSGGQEHQKHQKPPTEWLPLNWFAPINALADLFEKERLLLPTKPQKQSLAGSLTIVNVEEDVM